MIEEAIRKQMSQKTHEKTLIDKLLGRKEAEELKTLISKRKLTREELLKLINIVSGVQAKLLNLDQKDRYILIKFYAWLREYIGQCLLYMDAIETIDDELKKQKSQYDEGTIKAINELKDKIWNQLEHVAKAMIDFYLNICMTSLSIGGAFFSEAFKNKFEVDYRNTINQGEQPENKKGAMKW